MLQLFSSLKSLLKIKKVLSDSPILRLHYHATVIALIVFSLVCSARQYLGEPIRCLTDCNFDGCVDTVNNFCWIETTYTYNSNHDPQYIKDGFLAYPGIGPQQKEGLQNDKREIKYYQWVAFVLFFQVRRFRFVFKCTKSF